MAPLPAPDDPTLVAIDRAIKEKENAQPPRPYLGMSAIGDECSRKLWYGFRWASRASFDAATIKRFADGHAGEDVQAARLRLVPGIELHTHDPDGKQFGFRDHNDHFRGHMDGVVIGLLQAPRTWHVWEHKQVDEKGQAKLASLKVEVGEKAALKAWKPVYHAQAVLYMDYAGLDRHYLTCSTPGGRHTISVRTDADPAEAVRLRAKAKAIIEADNPPPRLSSDPGYYLCRWCDHQAVCHQAAPPIRNCRTCIYAETWVDGLWWCNKHERQTNDEPCSSHRYIPALVPGEQVDAAPDGEWIAYVVTPDPEGERWIDQGAGWPG